LGRLWGSRLRRSTLDRIGSHSGLCCLTLSRCVQTARKIRQRISAVENSSQHTGDKFMRDRKTFGWRAAGLTAALLSLAGCGGGGSNGGGGFFPVTVAPPPAADNGAAPPAPAPAPAPVTAQQACTSLEGKTVGAATVTAAAVVAASGEVPAYCKVNARIDPKLNFELRLPDAWNSKLQYFGGGGYNGSIPPLVAGDLLSLPAIKKGFATVGSDSGHQASGLDASWALTDPTAAQLFGSLSVPTVMSSVVECSRWPMARHLQSRTSKAVRTEAVKP
jgi:hypothetical protein